LLKTKYPKEVDHDYAWNDAPKIDEFPGPAGRCELHIYDGLGHLLTRKVDRQAQLRGDFDFDPKATADADDKIWKFLEELGYLAR